MRILLGFLVVFLSSTSLYCQLSDQGFREKLKNSLYNCQIGMMDWEKYNQLIEPYIQEAENTLGVSSYIKMNPDHKVAHRYLNSLLNYNIAVFHNIAVDNSYTKGLLEKRYTYLLNSIDGVKKEASLDTLSLEDEAEKTIDLLRRANLAYYQELGIGIKFKHRFLRFLARI